MKNFNYDVMTLILFAVETGGQEYGNADFNSFVPVAGNTPYERSITIGAGGFYASNAQRLLAIVRRDYPDLFASLDTAGIGYDLDHCNWSKYDVARGSSKAVCIQRIIGSREGIASQKKLMQEMIREIETAILRNFGIMQDTAMMECININWQGGMKALKRILAKTTKPYSLGSIYAALCTDPADKSSSNQVGDYISRQKRVYEMICSHADSGEDQVAYNDEMQVRQSVINAALPWIGLSQATGTHKKIIDIYNGHHPLARGYKVSYSDFYCATTVSAASIVAGLTDIMPTECGCGQKVALYQKLGRWMEDDAYVPGVGDEIYYDWEDDGVGDCTGWPNHVGLVETVKDGVITVIEGNMNGGIVGRRRIAVNSKNIRGFAIPDFASKVNSRPSPMPTPVVPVVPKPESISLERNLQWNGVVAASSLNVRTWAGTGYKTCTFSPLEQGEKIAVCDSIKATDGETWYYIKNKDGKYGFVHSKYVTNADPQPAAPEEPDDKISNVPKYVGEVFNCNQLNVRTWAGTEYANIRSYPILNAGNRIDVCDSIKSRDGADWLFIRIRKQDGNYCFGFVHSAYIKRI